jgi:SAM-dependent MidA family methyltransferase
VRFKEAMRQALYGDGGFFTAERPADHFRTSALASPLFAEALAVLTVRLDERLGGPDPFQLVDVGAGRGELLERLLGFLPGPLRRRTNPTAVEVVQHDRPGWRTDLPAGVTGLLLATEWLDNVPVDLVELDVTGRRRYLEHDLTPGDPVLPGADAAWLDAWWPLREAGQRAEVGLPRDRAWAAAVGAVERGLALTVDYGHLADRRPPLGTLTGFRAGREVDPVADGSCDLSVAVAFDAVRAAPRVPRNDLLRQREALARLGVSGVRPALAMASTDPAGYVEALARAGAAAELRDPQGLGGHWWLRQWV